MTKKLNFLNSIRRKILSLSSIESMLLRNAILLGQIRMGQLSDAIFTNIEDYEFKVFSQWGEDGIIQFLIKQIDIKNKIFVEFGVENYTEANTRFLLQNNNWSGLVIDGSEDNINFIKRDSMFWKHDLSAECAFINKENINNIIKKNGIEGDIGLLSIDVDGNDYWIWEAIDCINPAIVICEYNSVFGPKAKVSIPYDKDFQRTNAHYSNLYWGASIGALEYLATKKGYKLIGSNSVGCNAFFIRNDINGRNSLLSKRDAQDAYRQSKFRGSRDEDGKLICLPFSKRFEIIKDLMVIDVEKNEAKKISNICEF